MSKLESIINDIKNLSVIDLNELTLLLEKEFGVSAQSFSASANTNTSNEGEKPSAENAKTIFKVELKEAGSDKMKILKALRTIKKDISLIDAKNAVENTPYIIFNEASKDDADNAKKVLEEAGGKVAIS